MSGEQKMGKKKEKKKGLNAEQKYTEKQLMLLARFGMSPNLDVSEKDAAVLDTVSELGDVSFFTLCDRLDEKPSKMYGRLNVLENKGLVQYSEAEKIVSLTPIAIQFLGCRLEDTKSEKKFRKFIECLKDEDIDRFVELIDRFKIDESLLSEEQGSEEAEPVEAAPEVSVPETSDTEATEVEQEEEVSEEVEDAQ